MTRIISNDDMANVRNSLAQAGIYFDKLYINQAYFNSNFTIQTSNSKPKKSSNNFWQKLLCASKSKQSSTGTQTVLTVRDDSELKAPPPIIRRSRLTPTDNIYDRRRCRPINREYANNNYQQTIRRRRSSLVTRSMQAQRQKLHMNTDDEDNDEFAV